MIKNNSLNAWIYQSKAIPLLYKRYDMNIYSDSKISDLVKVVGKETSENFSPTLRAKLVTINEHAGMCTMEITPSPYELKEEYTQLIGYRYERPIAYVWNAYFF